MRESNFESNEEATEVNWIEYLSEFKEEIYPIFEKHGISFADAIIIWKLNTVRNSIDKVEELLEGERNA